MTSYKIYLGLETKQGKVIDISEVYSYLSELGIEGATIIETMGFYKGTLEKSCIIELIIKSDVYTKISLLTIADAIKEKFNQEEVLCTSQYTKIHRGGN